MKKLFRSFTIITLIICIVFGGSCFGCGGCFGCSGCFGCGDSWDDEEAFLDISRGTELPISETYLKPISENFLEKKDSQDEYVESLIVTLVVEGYNKAFVYFDGVVKATVICDAITEENHKGEKINHEIIIELNRQGNGTQTKIIEFKNCYSVEVVAIKYTFSGTVVKK